MPLGISALADDAFAAFPAADDPSEGTPLGQLARLRPLARQHLLVAEPWDENGGVETYGIDPAGTPGVPGVRKVYLSSAGYVVPPDGAGSGEGVADYRHFPAVLISPGNLRVTLISGGRFSSRVTFGIGNIVIANPNGELDHLLRLDWERRSLKVWMGERLWMGPSFNQFGIIRRGSVVGVSGGQDRFSLEVKDLRDLLDKELNPGLYRGYGNAIRGDGLGDVVDFNDGVQFDETQDFTVKLRVRWPAEVTTVDTALVNRATAFGATDAGYSIYCQGPAAQIRVSGCDGTTSALAIGNGAPEVDDGEWHDVELVWDRSGALGTADRLYVHLDGVDARVGGGIDTSAVGSLVDQTQNLRLLSGDNNPAACDVAQVEVYDHARTLQQHKDDLGRVLDESRHVEGLVSLKTIQAGAGSTVFEQHPLTKEHLLADGVDDKIEVDLASPLYGGVLGYTIELGLRDDVQGTADTLWSEGHATDNNPYVQIRSGGTLKTDLWWQARDDELNASTIAWNDVFRGAGPRSLVLTDTGGTLNLYLDRKLHQPSPRTYSGQGVTTLNLAGLFALFRATPIQHFKARLYYARLWSRVLSATEVAENAWRKTVKDASNLEVQLWLDEGTGTPADSSGNSRTVTLTGGTWGDADGTITGATWIGSGEGGADLQGKRKRRRWGKQRQCEGDLIDPQRVVYQVAANSCKSIVPKVNGVASYSALGDQTDIYDTAPGAGQYTTQLSKGLVRLNSVPTGVLSFDVEGNDEGGYVETTGEIVDRIVRDDGGLTSGQIDSFQIGVVTLGRPGAVGYSTGRSPVTIADALSELMAGVDGWWSFDLRTGLFSVDLRELPGSSFNFELIGSDVLLNRLRRVATPAPTKSQVLSYRPYEITVDLDEYAGTDEDERTDLKQGERSVAFPDNEDSEIAQRHLDARVANGRTLYDLREDAEAEAQRRQAIDRLKHAVWEVPVADTFFQHTVGMHAKVTLPVEGLRDGKVLLLGGIVESDRSSEVSLTFWGLRD